MLYLFYQTVITIQERIPHCGSWYFRVQTMKISSYDLDILHPQIHLSLSYAPTALYLTLCGLGQGGKKNYLK